MITPAQMRAARAILNVSQTVVARDIGIAPNTLSDIETGKAQNVPASRLQEIQDFYDRQGIEFTDGEGARKKGPGVIVFEGRDGFAQFRKDVLEQARKGNPDICVSNVDERFFNKWGEGEVNDHYRTAMAEIVRENPKVRARFLVKKGDHNLAAKGHAEYRWIPDSDFGDFPFYVYGDKTAMIPFEENELHIFVVSHPLIAHYFRSQFNEKWNSGSAAE